MRGRGSKNCGIARLDNFGQGLYIYISLAFLMTYSGGPIPCCTNILIPVYRNVYGLINIANQILVYCKNFNLLYHCKELNDNFIYFQHWRCYMYFYCSTTMGSVVPSLKC